MTRISADRISRARSSRKWSDSGILPSGPTGLRGLPRRTSTTPTMDIGEGARAQTPSGGVVATRGLALGGLLGLERLALGGLSSLQLSLRVGRGLAVVVLAQTLGLGLEDAQCAAAAPSELGEL